jgi:hypothetical protein
MYTYGTTWIFNSPHASHFGGAWESMIGVASRILDSMLLEPVNRNLTHDILSTLMAELSAIVNSRTLASVSIDSDSPFVLSPNVLLTQKDSTSSMCIYLVTRQVKKMAHRFDCALPPRVLCVVICQGPNVSTPTFVKGGDGSSLSEGRSAIF